MDEQKQLKRNLIMYPLGTVGRDMIYALFTNYILTFVLFTRVLSASQLAAITAIMVAARIFDGLNDPIMGNIIERTRTKWGKFKPWLLIGVITSSIVVTLAFNCKFQGWSFVVFFGIIYFLYSITYTMNDISYWGMVPALSSDGNTRNQFTSRATLFAGIGSTLASVLIPMFTTGEMALGGNTATAYGIIAIVICILSPLFILFTLFGVKENRSDMAEPAPKISFKMIVKTIAGNDQLLWISLIFLLQQIGNGIVIGGIGSTYIYFEFGYNGGLYSLFTTVGMSVTALLMIFYPTISRKTNRKPLMTIMQIIALVGYAVMLVAGLLLPATMIKFYIITIGYMAANFGQYCFYLIMMISIINTVEYNEYKHGNRAEAIISSLRPFLTKLASALCVAITSGTYLIFGVTKITNQISTFENQASMNAITESQKLSSIGDLLKTIHASQSKGLLFAMTLVPLAFMLASYFIYKAKYNLDEAEYDRICKELEARKAVK
ncbi:MAG: glycoside-pentoside-hexuronide (GPH):cation symporter [Sphaerochaetaceae bacterium]|nr:glycoside-pentoside-hexuronide (GPH):cation symporter [Sphaerochaetaceae bacterium]